MYQIKQTGKLLMAALFLLAFSTPQCHAEGAYSYYFAYGSNLNEARMKTRCGDVMAIGKARLEGYRLDFTRRSRTWGGGVADIVEEEGAEVWGLLYRVSEEGLKVLDRYEGHPKSYHRKEVTVIDEEGWKIKAVTYEVVEKESFIPPTEEYLAMVKKGAGKLCFPEAYINELDNIEVSCGQVAN